MLCTASASEGMLSICVVQLSVSMQTFVLVMRQVPSLLSCSWHISSGNMAVQYGVVTTTAIPIHCCQCFSELLHPTNTTALGE